MSEYEPLTDMDIVNLIDQNIGVSVGYYDSELSNERKEVVDYYNAHLPKPAHDGNSKYCSMDVDDAVEAMKAALVETFSGGTRLFGLPQALPKMCLSPKLPQGILTMLPFNKMICTAFSAKLFTMPDSSCWYL